MIIPNDVRPLAVMMSKRANVFYLERVRVSQKEERVVYMTETGQPIEHIVNIPDKNTSVLLLGKGSSITDAAVRKLAESNVVIGFCGSGGSPLVSISDPVFLLPQDEYRPTEYMQWWCKKWFDDDARLLMAKDFLRYRIELNIDSFSKAGILPESKLFTTFRSSIDSAATSQELLAAEGRYAKSLYAHFSIFHKIEFTRNEGLRLKDSETDRVNSFLDHGNYLCYGYAAVALHVLGISYAFPVLHGKTRRGALVFDVADLIKDWLVMPIAFEAGKHGWEDRRFRAEIINRTLKGQILDILIDFIKSIAKKIY